MNIGTNGVIIDQKMQLLVIKRDDTRTWASPGGALDAGELPTEGVVREVEEETGFKILPVRLVGVSYIPDFGQGFLQFTFRCLLRGGEARTSRESLAIGFIPTNPIKAPMLNFSRIRLEKALVHHHNVPHWETTKLSARERMLYRLMVGVYYPTKNWVERTFRKHVYTPPPDWTVIVNLLVQQPDGAVLWIKDGEGWQLPADQTREREAPWEAAERLGKQLFGEALRLTHLTGVYNIGKSQEVVLVFSAESPSSIPPTAEFHASIPDTANPLQQERVTDALEPLNELTVFKRQSAELS